MKRKQFERELGKRGFNQTTFAEYIGLSRWGIMDIINCKHKVVRMDTIGLIADGLDLTYEETERILNDVSA